MEFDKKHWIGVIFAVIIIAVDLIFLRGEKFFLFVIGVGLVVGVMPFIINLMFESRKDKENADMFLEFARNLAESVKAGTPISKSILNVKNKYYGSLTPHVQKLANQIALGIPVNAALRTFAQDVNSKTILRAITIISEAEKAGGEIEKILDSVAKSVAEIEKLKKERRSAIFGLVIQGYIIFTIFIVIMLILQFKILPITSELGNLGSITSGGGDSAFASAGIPISGGGTSGVSADQFKYAFLALLLSQGLFVGLIIGKLSEGEIKAGIKHSFILMVLAYLVTTGATVFA